jgi:hypothetical protein
MSSLTGLGMIAVIVIILVVILFSLGDKEK